MLLHFVVFAHRSTTTPRSFASRRGKYFLCKLPWNLAARNFGAGKAAGRKLTGRKPETRTKHALKFQPVQACVLLSTEGIPSKTYKKSLPLKERLMSNVRPFLIFQKILRAVTPCSRRAAASVGFSTFSALFLLQAPRLPGVFGPIPSATLDKDLHLNDLNFVFIDYLIPAPRVCQS